MTTIVAPPWEEQPTGGGIADAPTDGKTYGRKDAAWAEVVAPERAAEIVTAAALPMPDVWAPLSDSLRLITGYGRDVLVGSDVVARMVNFSRNSTATYIGKDGVLKTAAANEPRFEKEGLLIEGQSTNLIPTSAALTTQTLYVQDGTHTLSFYGTGSVSLSGASTGAITGTGAGDRVALTFTATAGNITLTVTGACTNGQLEALPFASSYIPTSGAAVTRAQDTCWLPSQQNLVPVVGGPDGAPFTIACEVNALPGTVGGSESRTVVDIGAGSSSISLNSSGVNLFVRVFNGPFVITPFVGGKVLGLVRQSEVVACSNKNVIAKTASTATVLVPTTRPLRIGYWSPQDSGVGDANFRNLWGHVRNLRIWRRNLTDDQIKAIA